MASRAVCVISSASNCVAHGMKITFCGVGVGVEVGFEVGAGLTTATPLFQINFFPDLTQVNFLFREITFWFKTLQVLPGVIFWADTAVTGIRARARANNMPLRRLALILIPKG